MFNNRNGRTVEAVNRTYHPLGNYADNPEIDLNDLNFDQACRVVAENGFTGKPSNTKL